MPITHVSLGPTLGAALAATGMLGPSAPNFAIAIANGICEWTPSIVVATVDVGSAGSGNGTTVFAVPQPALLAALQEQFVAVGLLGAMAPPMATGLATGLATGFLSGLVITQHTSVGTGTGVATFKAPPPYPLLLASLLAQGITGPGAQQVALALSTALLEVLSVFIVPVVIVGSASPTPSSGVGVGVVL